MTQKTKTVRRECLIDVDDSGRMSIGDYMTTGIAMGAYRGEVTFEVPVEEKKITITESDFDQACMQVTTASDRDELLSKLKAKLFGGE